MSGIPQGAKRLGPGFYDTGDGSLHIDLPELIRASGGDPSSPADVASAERLIAEKAQTLQIPVETREDL